MTSLVAWPAIVVGFALGLGLGLMVGFRACRAHWWRMRQERIEGQQIRELYHQNARLALRIVVLLAEREHGT